MEVPTGTNDRRNDYREGLNGKGHWKGWGALYAAEGSICLSFDLREISRPAKCHRVTPTMVLTRTGRMAGWSIFRVNWQL